MPKLGSGARWDLLMNIFVDGCTKKWWTFLLHTQNFVDTSNYVNEYTLIIGNFFQIFHASD